MCHFVEFAPEVSGIGLRRCKRGPVIADMLILTGQLTPIATIAFFVIEDEYLHLCLLDQIR
jgi:hypothetical protein